MWVAQRPYELLGADQVPDGKLSRDHLIPARRWRQVGRASRPSPRPRAAREGPSIQPGIRFAASPVGPPVGDIGNRYPRRRRRDDTTPRMQFSASMSAPQGRLKWIGHRLYHGPAMLAGARKADLCACQIRRVREAHRKASADRPSRGEDVHSHRGADDRIPDRIRDAGLIARRFGAPVIRCDVERDMSPVGTSVLSLVRRGAVSRRPGGARRTPVKSSRSAAPAPPSALTLENLQGQTVFGLQCAAALPTERRLGERQPHSSGPM